VILRGSKTHCFGLNTAAEAFNFIYWVGCVAISLFKENSCVFLYAGAEIYGEGCTFPGIKTLLESET